MIQDNGFSKLDKLATEGLAWAKETFPRSSALGVFKHLQREVGELIACLEQDPAHGEPTPTGIQITPGNCVEEAADIMLLYIQGLKRLDLDLEFIYNQALIKMEINKRRQWGEQNADGFTEHVK